MNIRVIKDGFSLLVALLILLPLAIIICLFPYDTDADLNDFDIYN